MGHYVYKYVLNDEIIYIGKNDTDLYSRLNQHGRPGDNISEEAWDEINKSRVYYCEVANKTMSDVVESEMIRRYKPKYNKAKMSDWAGLPFVEPAWIFAPENDNRDDRIRELEALLTASEREKNSLEKKIKTLETEYIEKRKYMCCHCDVRHKYDDIVNLKYNNLTLNKDTSAKDFDEILDLYRSEIFKEGSYISEAYDKHGNLVCKKLLYINSYGHLKFDFWQINCLDGRKSGTVFNSPSDIRKLNWNVLRAWINRGDGAYYLSE